MSNSTIRAALDDGPRVGEVLEVETEATGSPPTTLVVSDPLRDGPADSTTYHLHQEGDEPGSYVYRTGAPDDVEASDEPSSGDSGEQLQKERMDSEGGA